MDVLIMIIAATLILGFLVVIHEGGHFLAARAFGVRVTEFMVGLPGPNVGFTFKGTKFGVTAVPLGGYAQVCGMAPPTNSPHLKRMLGYVYRHGTVTLADTARDLFLTEDEAFELLEELSDWGSVKRPRRRDKTDVYRVPAASGRACGQAAPVADLDAFFASEQAQQYSQLPFWKRCTILLAGPAMNLVWVIVAFVVVYSVMGFDLQNTQTGEVFHRTLAPWDAVSAGFGYLGMVAVAIAGLFNPQTAGEVVSQSSSVVGIAVMSKTAIESGMQTTLIFSAIVSASLGLMNLLPIPPLDGGRFVVEVFQKISRRIVSIRVLNYLSIAGLTLFTGLFLVMLNQDVQRILSGFWG